MPTEASLFEKSHPDRVGLRVPPAGVAGTGWRSGLPAGTLRAEPPALPALSEPEVVRHFTRISRKNYAIDSGFYPLGSCTMKYNPKVNELLARLPGFANLHPYQPLSTVQGALAVMAELEERLVALTGMARVTLQPAAGAHGELTGILIIKAYHEDREDRDRTEIIVPDSAHGTNPATAALAGYTVVTVPSDARGQVDMAALRAVVGPRTAGMMLTNPNTAGLFEEDIQAITALVHEAGGLMYYDGANFNAIMGLVRPGDMGFDVVHLNLHKTMTTPHGGGGPGSGPVGVSARLEPYLPTPLVVRQADCLGLEYDRPKSIGRVKAFYGNFGMHVRALAYILSMGGDGLRQASEDAVLNANYLRVRLSDKFKVAYDQVCMHEFVLSGEPQKKAGANTLAMAKRLIDYGYHPMTIYFPLIVPEAMMIEPTETESRATLDAFVTAMAAIADEVATDPGLVTSAPQTAPVGRVDEALAARKPDFRWSSAGEGQIEPAAAAARPAGCA